jgi:deoxycytidylate deaminase
MNEAQTRLDKIEFDRAVPCHMLRKEIIAHMIKESL